MAEGSRLCMSLIGQSASPLLRLPGASSSLNTDPLLGLGLVAPHLPTGSLLPETEGSHSATLRAWEWTGTPHTVTFELCLHHTYGGPSSSFPQLIHKSQPCPQYTVIIFGGHWHIHLAFPHSFPSHIPNNSLCTLQISDTQEISVGSIRMKSFVSTCGWPGPNLSQWEQLSVSLKTLITAAIP